MLLRALLPLVAIFALVGASMTAWAAAGLSGEQGCCCPVPETCKCDHDRGGTTSSIDECRGPGMLVAPSVEIATVPGVAVVGVARRDVVRVAVTPAPMPDERFVQPETPPF